MELFNLTTNNVPFISNLVHSRFSSFIFFIQSIVYCSTVKTFSKLFSNKPSLIRNTSIFKSLEDLHMINGFLNTPHK